MNAFAPIARPHPSRPRVTRRTAMLSALLALALSTGPPATAGPREARARWKEAQALKAAPWRARLEALRAVRRETGPTDGYFARALMAEADVLRTAGHHPTAAASEAAAASAGARRDPDRLAHALSAARTLEADGDRRGARDSLGDVLEHGGSATPWITGPAVELLGRIESDEGDADALDRLTARAAADVADRYDVRLVLLDLAGRLALRRGDRSRAERRLADERRLFSEARRSGGTADRLASEAWLSLELPKRLDMR